MRQDLKKSVSFLLEGEEKIISFGYDFINTDYLPEKMKKRYFEL